MSKRIRSTVVIALLAILLVVALGGCNMGNTTDPLVGTWKMSAAGSTFTFEFFANNTYNFVVTGVVSVSESGTWAYGSGATLNLTGLFSGDTYNYTFGAAYTALTLSGTNTYFLMRQ